MGKLITILLFAFTVITAEEAKYVKATGSSTIEVMPNCASLKLGVTSIKLSADSAVSEVSKVSSIILDVLNKMKIDSADISTTDFNVTRESEYTKEREKKFIGYKVAVIYKVDVKNIKILDTLLLNCIKIGSNAIDNITFYHDKIDSIKNEVTKSAMRNAYTNAENMVKPMKQKVGTLLKVTDNQYDDFDIDNDFLGKIEAPEFMKGAALGTSNKITENYYIRIIPGKIKISKTIYAIFEIISEKKE